MRSQDSLGTPEGPQETPRGHQEPPQGRAKLPKSSPTLPLEHPKGTQKRQLAPPAPPKGPPEANKQVGKPHNMPKA